MAVYTLHVPADGVPGDPAVLGDAVLLKDGFAWGAFIFQVLWCLYHRLWLAALGLAIITFGVSAGLQWLDIPALATTVISLLIAGFFALEANGLRRRALERRGFRAAGVVVADSASDGETRAFSAWLAKRATGVAPRTGTNPNHNQGPAGPAGREPLLPSAPSPRPVAGPHPVLGLFPEPEGAR